MILGKLRVAVLKKIWRRKWSIRSKLDLEQWYISVGAPLDNEHWPKLWHQRQSFTPNVPGRCVLPTASIDCNLSTTPDLPTNMWIRAARSSLSSSRDGSTPQRSNTPSHHSLKIWRLDSLDDPKVELQLVEDLEQCPPVPYTCCERPKCRTGFPTLRFKSE
ncbi:hypothetical protein BSKO_04088 [Bryopsis sp. KO-2023]|nr:hypothetical protein BSKO_04088 [Bryopsis sp. KO-2023]